MCRVWDVSRSSNKLYNASKSALLRGPLVRQEKQVRKTKDTADTRL